jgi:tRNA(Ile)-lysidine synthase
MSLSDRVLAAMRAADSRGQTPNVTPLGSGEGGDSRGLTPIVVALSGGGDSVALLYLLRELQERGALVVASVAHLNHQLRGAAADADERFCRELAARLGLRIVVERMDVAGLADARGMSIEEAGHHAREEFLARAAAAVDAVAVATGHTRDDQAETFLLRLLRGAGARGLAGIHPRAGCFIRPLLDVSRRELREYLDVRGIAYCEDESNQDIRVPRNWIRQRLIPQLQEQWTEGIVDVLARNATIARDDADELDRHASEMAGSIVLVKDDAIELDAARLRELPRALGRRVALRAMTAALRLRSGQGAGSRAIGYDHVIRVLDLAASNARDGAAVDLPGHRAVRLGSRLVLTAPLLRSGVAPAFRRGRLPGLKAGTATIDREAALPVPGEARFGEGWVISAERSAGIDGRVLGAPSGTDTWVAVSGEVGTPLTVRARRPGDMFRPLGLGGRKKLQDLFTDRKVPRAERDSVPVVVDAQNRIVWVVGHAIAEDFRVSDRRGAVVILKARKAQGA